MSLFGGNQTTSSLFNNNPTGGLFGQQGNTPITTGTSLFSSITGNNPQGPSTGLFGQPTGTAPNTGLFTQSASTAPNSGLFGTNPNPSGGLFTQNQGSLFNNPQSGSLFNPNPAGSAQTGLFGANPSSQGSLFSGSFGTNSTGLFNSMTTTPSLFTNAGAGQQGGLFNQPSNPNFSSGMNPGQAAPPMVYTQNPGYHNKIIDNLTQTEKESLFKLKSLIDDNDSQLLQSQGTLEKICKFKSDLKLRLLDLFTYARKVQTSEKRCKASVEIVKKFQSNLNLFIKDAIKVFDRCEHADSYHQIDSPGNFLSDMLIHCEERLKSIEENYKEIQELLLIEQKSSEFVLLVNTISMMQTKFEIISSIAFDVHKRVEEVIDRYANTFGIDPGNEKVKDVKMKEVVKPKKFSTLADIIAARPSAFSKFFH